MVGFQAVVVDVKRGPCPTCDAAGNRTWLVAVISVLYWESDLRALDRIRSNKSFILKLISHKSFFGLSVFYFERYLYGLFFEFSVGSGRRARHTSGDK